MRYAAVGKKSVAAGRLGPGSGAAIRVLTVSPTGGLETIIDEIEVGEFDGSLDGADPVAFLSWFFAGVDFPAPAGHELCLATPGDPDVITAVGLQVLDWNDSGDLDLADGVTQLSWTFSGAVEHPDCIPTVLVPPNCPNCIQVDNTNCIDTCTPD